MSKIAVKVEIPINSPDDLIKLAADVVDHNTVLGEKSPLSGIDMTTFSTKLQSGKEKRAQAKKLHEQAEALNQEAILNLGISKTQNSKTPDTVYSTLTSVRDILLALNKGQEEKLSEWGFNITSTIVKQKKGSTSAS
jgi:hypothetical protein